VAAAAAAEVALETAERSDEARAVTEPLAELRADEAEEEAPAPAEDEEAEEDEEDEPEAQPTSPGTVTPAVWQSWTAKPTAFFWSASGQPLEIQHERFSR
jgi:hypothetical protein